VTIDQRKEPTVADPNFFIVQNEGVYHFTQTLWVFDPATDPATLSQAQSDSFNWVKQTHADGVAASADRGLAAPVAVPVAQSRVVAMTQITTISHP
jgi:hypothetical protein